MSNFQYYVCLYGKKGKSTYSPNKLSSRRRKFAKGKADHITWGMLFRRTKQFESTNSTKQQGQPVTIYLN